MKAQHLLPLAALSAITATVSPAQATTNYLVFIYVNGVPTNATAYSSVTNGHVFLNGNWIGTINAYGHIINAENEMVGYVVEDEGEIGKITFSKWWKSQTK